MPFHNIPYGTQHKRIPTFYKRYVNTYQTANTSDVEWIHH